MNIDSDSIRRIGQAVAEAMKGVNIKVAPAASHARMVTWLGMTMVARVLVFGAVAAIAGWHEHWLFAAFCVPAYLITAPSMKVE